MFITLTRLVAVYLVFTATYTCPINRPLQPIAEHSIVDVFNARTCEIIHTHAKPVWRHTEHFLGHYVAPTWNQHVVPTAIVVGRVAKDRTDQGVAYFEREVAPVLVASYERHVEPVLATLRARLAYLWARFAAAATYYGQLLAIAARKQYFAHVYPRLLWLYEVDQIKQGVDWARDMYGRIYTSCPTIQDKLDFLKGEVSLVKFNEFGKKAGSASLVQAVKDLFKGEEPEKRKKTRNVKTGSVFKAEATGSVSEAEAEATGHSDYDLVTSTITITNTETLDGSVSTDLVVSLIDEEIAYWSAKINKTLELAVAQIEDGMAPLVNASIAELMDPVSAQLQDVQKQNYANYKRLNEMIQDINRDYERIKTEGNGSIEHVSRQDMRDLIEETRNIPSNASVVISEWVSDKHDKLVSAYFRVLQETIDVLETFAESTVSVFQKKMAVILDEEHDDDAVWRAWKRFHAVKEQIFEFRDFLFEQANAYKRDSKTSALGLQAWNEYIRKVDFHVNFLVRDNNDYLSLVRAKANVAFQMREGEKERLEEERKEERREEERKENERKEEERKEEERKENERKENERKENERKENERKRNTEKKREENNTSIGNEKVKKNNQEGKDDVIKQNETDVQIQTTQPDPSSIPEEDFIEGDSDDDEIEEDPDYEYMTQVYVITVH